jgi:hypothetical protein
VAGQPGQGLPARAGVPGAVRGGARTGLRRCSLDPRAAGPVPAEEYLCQLAILNHAATSDDLTDPFAERFLKSIAPDAAEAVRHAMAGGVDGFRRWFLARQLVLRAMRLVLVPPRAAAGGAADGALEASLGGIDQETAAVLLVHLAGDALCQERQLGEARLCGMAESLAMEMNANNLFNDRDDNGDLLARYRMLWLGYGTRCKRYVPRLPPADMLREATGIGFDETITLAFAYWGYLQGRGPGDPVRVKAMVAPAMTIPRADVGAFLGLFSCTPAALAQELRQCPRPWQMRPLQARPLLSLGDDVVVLDERYLIERVTRGLYWLVHDHEKETYSDKARGAWTQVWSEMVEARAEDQLRQMAPALLDGKREFFTEEALQAAFPGTKNCDAGLIFGGDVVLAEVVSGTVKVQTRELADVGSFVQDTERIVLCKARQLYVTTANLLRRPQPGNSPVGIRPSRIFPVVVISGQYPVNPLTVRYINEQLTAEGHRPDGTVQPLTVMDLEELEGCQALLQRKGRTLPSCGAPGGSRPTATLPSATTWLTRSADRNSAGQATCRTPWRNRSKSSSGCSAPREPGHRRDGQGSSRPARDPLPRSHYKGPGRTGGRRLGAGW